MLSLIFLEEKMKIEKSVISNETVFQMMVCIAYFCVNSGIMRNRQQ